jgi:hypothetical protein
MKVNQSRIFTRKHRLPLAYSLLLHCFFYMFYKVKSFKRDAKRVNNLKYNIPMFCANV